MKEKFVNWFNSVSYPLAWVMFGVAFAMFDLYAGVLRFSEGRWGYGIFQLVLCGIMVALTVYWVRELRRRYRGVVFTAYKMGQSGYDVTKDEA